MEFNSSNGLGLFVPVFDCPLLDRQQNFKKVHEIFNRPISCKKQYQNRAGVLEKPCSGTFGSWLHAFLGKTGAPPKVKSYVTLPFRKIRNCKGLDAPLPGIDIATSG